MAQFLAHKPFNFASFIDSFIVLFSKFRSWMQTQQKQISFPGPKSYLDFRETAPKRAFARKYDLKSSWSNALRKLHYFLSNHEQGEPRTRMKCNCYSNLNHWKCFFFVCFFTENQVLCFWENSIRHRKAKWQQQSQLVCSFVACS